MKNKYKLIGITGKARSGKDTIAKYLWQEHDFVRISLAYPLKQAARIIFNLSYDQAFCDELKEEVIPYWGLSPRQMFQKLGTDAVLCTFGQMTWVKHWLQTYSTLSETDHVVVPDIRKDFEAEALLKLGGIIIEVRRGTGLAGETGKHTSESGLETVIPHYVIDNHGTVDELCRMVDSIMKELA